MINLNYKGVKVTLLSPNLININFNWFKPTQTGETVAPCQVTSTKADKGFSDYKTTLSGSCVNIIDQIEDDLNIYLFIEKHKESSSSWNLIIPVIQEYSTKKIHQFKNGHFALEGCGGGLSNMRSLMYYAGKPQKKGYKIRLIPKVVENSLLKKFEYVDNDINLKDLEEATDLSMYKKGPFKWIFEQYSELLNKYGLK